MQQPSEYVYVGTQVLGHLEVLKNYNNAIVEHLVAASPKPAAHTLDFGAGLGTLASMMLQRGLRVECLEPDRGQRDRIAQTLGVRTYSSLAEIPDASYEYVYSSNVLEHIDDDVATLREIRRIIVPDGRICLYVPAFMSLYSNMDVAVGHCRRYVKGSMSSALASAGFRILDLHYADFLGFFTTLLFKLASNRMTDANPRTFRLYDRAIFPISRFVERFVHFPVGKNLLVIAEPV